MSLLLAMLALLPNLVALLAMVVGVGHSPCHRADREGKTRSPSHPRSWAGSGRGPSSRSSDGEASNCRPYVGSGFRALSERRSDGTRPFSDSPHPYQVSQSRHPQHLSMVVVVL